MYKACSWSTCIVLTYSELSTVFIECANLLNDKLVGNHPQDPDDGKYLCPNDLLFGRVSSSIPSGSFEFTTNIKRRYEFVESVVECYWKKMDKGFLSKPHYTTEVAYRKGNLQIDDVVLIRDDKLVRGKWRMARITS